MTLIMMWAMVAAIVIAVSLALTGGLVRAGFSNEAGSGAIRAAITIVAVALLCGGLLKLSLGFNGELLGGICITLVISLVLGNMIWGSAVTLCGTILIWTISTSPIFRSEEIANRFSPDEVTQTFFHNQEKNKMRIIPKSVAIDLGKKKLNVRLADSGKQLGAAYTLDEELATIQYVRDELTWVIPLKWNSIGKYFGEKTIPGYVKVSATNSGKQELVLSIDNKPLKIKFAGDASFGGNLVRHVQTYEPTSRIIDHAFFITGGGEPRFVSFKAKPEVGFGNYIPDGLYETDAVTGSIRYYPKGEEPSYIDYTFSEAVALSMIDDWGYYREGLYNAFFGSTKIKATTYNSSSELFFIDSDGMSSNSAFFTGLTNGSGNDALVGMLFMDARTGQAFIKYSDTSAPDESAVLDSVNSALGNQAMNWSPKQPIPYRIYGTMDIWITPLVSNTNKLVGFAATKVNDAAPSVWDKTLDGVLSKIMNVSDSSGEINNEKLSETLKGTLRSYRQVSDSKAMLTLVGVPVLIECDTVKNDSCTAMLEGEEIEVSVIKRTENRALLTRYINSPVN
ncbi:hypothetical protein [Vibrio harveyi]|uniref:hypothetical protein n=1 Tax=Vibrio harveyi TaxID=669 RepID=UPI003CF03282